MSTEKVKPSDNGYYEKMDDGQVERQQLLNKNSRETTQDRFKSEENNGVFIRKSDSDFGRNSDSVLIRDNSLKRRTSVIEQIS